MPLRSNPKGLLPSLLIVATPVAVAAAIAIHGQTQSSQTLFFGMIQGYFLQFAVGVLMLSVGLAGFPSDESNGVVAYLLTKPIPRSGILLGRVLSSCAVGAILVLLSVTAAGLVLRAGLKTVLTVIPALVAACVHYGVVFTVLPLFTSRATAFGLIYVLVWESVMVVIPGAVHTFTASFYVRALLPAAATPRLPDLPFLAFLTARPSIAEAVARLIITWIIVACAGYLALRRRDYSASRAADEGV